MPRYEERARILQGAGDMIFKLVCERSTPEQWAEWLRAPLEHAAGTANHVLVKKLLKAGADGSAGWKGCHGKTLLHAAAEGGNGQVVTALIRAGGGGDKNAKSPNQQGRTPLHLAVLGGKEAAAKAMLLSGADVNILDVTGDAPLHSAIRGGHAGIVENLLISGADHAVRGSDDKCPIHLAARCGHKEIVLALVQKGENLERVDILEQTPLAVAVRHDRVSTAELLLTVGADANIPMGYYFKTALHVAAKFDKAASIPALIEAGAIVEARDRCGDTPLYDAAMYGSCAAMLALLRLGANVNSNNNVGSTPLRAACRRAKAGAADLLLRWGADETIVDGQGQTPSQRIPDIAGASEQRRPTLERLTKLLAHAPQDRTWRRRGFVVMCRAHPDRLRLIVNIPDNAAEVFGQQPEERRNRRARRGEVKVEVQMGGAYGGGAGSSNASARRRAGGEGAGGGFAVVAAWLMAVNEEDVFRNIVGFL